MLGFVQGLWLVNLHGNTQQKTANKSGWTFGGLLTSTWSGVYVGGGGGWQGRYSKAFPFHINGVHTWASGLKVRTENKVYFFVRLL